MTFRAPSQQVESGRADQGATQQRQMKEWTATGFLSLITRRFSGHCESSSHNISLLNRLNALLKRPEVDLDVTKTSYNNTHSKPTLYEVTQDTCISKKESIRRLKNTGKGQWWVIHVTSAWHILDLHTHRYPKCQLFVALSTTHLSYTDFVDIQSSDYRDWKRT